MGDGINLKRYWAGGNFAGCDTESTFTVGCEADSPSMDSLYGFGKQDDSFTDRFFDFESSSSSPGMKAAGQTDIASPDMATIETTSPHKTASQRRNYKPKTSSHKKHKSQCPTSFNGATAADSQEVPAMSSMVSIHDITSAAKFIDSVLPVGGHVDRNAIHSVGIDIAAATPTQFSNQGVRKKLMPRQIPPYNRAPVYNFAGGYELKILPTPLKSRVETQIPIKMILSPLPPGVTRLHLPAHTISKPKLLARPSPERSPNTLELQVSLVCTSAMLQGELKKKALERAATVPQGYMPDLYDEEDSPQNGGEVRICTGCIKRERKRAARKKFKKSEEEIIWSQDGERRAIVFNTREVEDWQPLSGVWDTSGRPDPVAPPHAMQFDAPMRIACYCRHHSEKRGFNVIFTIKDFQGRVVAQAMSNPIMITDDHKTYPMAQKSHPQVSETATSTTIPLNLPQAMNGNDRVPNVQNGASTVLQTNSDRTPAQRGGQPPHEDSTSGKTSPVMNTATVTRGTLCQSASSNQGGPAKKRKSNGCSASSGLRTTRPHTSPTGSQTSTHRSTATTSFTPKSSSFQLLEPMPGFLNDQPQFAGVRPTLDISDQAPFSSKPVVSTDNLGMTETYSAPISCRPSRTPSPNNLRNCLANETQYLFTPRLVANQYSLPLGVKQTRPPPVIHKIIPNEGPMVGGVEVTLLGAGFFQGLEIWFGEQKATTTTYWGDSCLVCLLPLSPVACTIVVTFKHQRVLETLDFAIGRQPTIFKFIDDSEGMLIRTALSVLGCKMSGRMVDVIDLAHRILNDGA